MKCSARVMNGAELSELPDESEQLRAFVSRLRQAADEAGGGPAGPPLSDGFLLKFLRARDFDVELSLKVGVRGVDHRKRDRPSGRPDVPAAVGQSLWFYSRIQNLFVEIQM